MEISDSQERPKMRYVVLTLIAGLIMLLFVPWQMFVVIFAFVFVQYFVMRTFSREPIDPYGERGKRDPDSILPTSPQTSPAKKCSFCGRDNPPDYNFCGSCGIRLEAA